MDVGLMTAFRFLPEKPEPLELVYKDFLEDCLYAEDLGYDFVRTSEHHFAPDGWSPSQLPILAWLAARTSRMRLGTAVLLLPFHNPLRIAEDAATVDIMSGGRLDLAVGAGSVTDEFESYNLDPADRWGLMFEGLQIIRSCFEEDSFTFEGRHYRFPNVRMTTKPVQKPFPLWVGAHGPKTLKRAAAAGYHMSGPYDPTDLYKSVGRNPDDYCAHVFIAGHIAASHDQAWDESEVGIHHFRNFYVTRDWIGGLERRGQPVPPVGEFRKQQGAGGLNNAVGTPDEVLKQLEGALKGTPVTHFGWFARHAGMKTEHVRRSMDLFAKEVMPEVRKWGRTPPVSRTQP